MAMLTDINEFDQEKETTFGAINLSAIHQQHAETSRNLGSEQSSHNHEVLVAGIRVDNRTTNQSLVASDTV